ncbi:hypothetical protein BDQ17DRAFT_1261856, partial [Cyathus striatus]
NKIGMITMDNVSNNNTFMVQVEQKLLEKGITFDKDGNCIQLLQLFEYSTSLCKDLIGKCQNLVAVCRASGKRHKELQDIIIEGNEKGYWAEELPVLQLLRDCETRWSSTYLMIDHVIHLYPVIFLHRSDGDLACHLFTDNDLSVLCDIRQVLEVPHLVQELLSGEYTPTLSLSLPAYETLLDNWRVYQKRTLPELSHYISTGMAKIEEYVSLARSTQMYAHAMVLNPTMKFTWLKKNWPSECVQDARNWTLEPVSLSNNFYVFHAHRILLMILQR